MCPNNRIGNVDLFLASRHGQPSSNSEALVHALQPRVVIINNGRIAGEGTPGRGGEPGDYYLITRLRPHRVFIRKGDDLYCEVPTTFAEAALGAEVEIASLNGKVKLKVPPESSSGRTLRLVGMGMPRLKGKGFGDLYVKLKIVTPKNLSEEEKRLISQWAKLRREDVRAGL